MTEQQLPDVQEVLDRDGILALMDGSVELLCELVGLFDEERTVALAEIQAALETDDASRLRLAAHSLRGTASHFRHNPTCAAARDLEVMGRSGDLGRARETFAVLVEAAAELQQALNQLKADLLP